VFNNKRQALAKITVITLKPLLASLKVPTEFPNIRNFT
jgi:hypothetical protein